MNISMTSRSLGELKRSRMAQLCRGFLVLHTSDVDRALAFLITFLKEAAKPEQES